MRYFLLAVVVAIVLPVPSVSRAAIGQFVDTETNCRVRSTDGTYEEPCRKGTLIENNDIIETSAGIGGLAIQWLSPRLLQVEKVGRNSYRLSLKRKQTGSETVRIVADMLAFARKSSLSKSRNAARGPGMVPPGKTASLLTGFDMTFTWCGAEPANLRIRDDAGREVLHAPIQGKGAVTLNLGNAGLSPDRTYFWTLGDEKTSTAGALKATPAAFENEILGILDEIRGSEKAPGERVLLQACFLLYAPEIYGHELDYRWLAYDLLRNQSIFDAKGRYIAAVLLEETGLGACVER